MENESGQGYNKKELPSVQCHFRKDKDSKMTNIIEELEARGFAPEVTSPALRELCAREMVTCYIGFDPTADSLHIGSLKQIMLLAQFQHRGHRPLAVVGGGTGMIGDPSGKTKERQLLSKDDIEKNLQGIRKQLERFLDFDCGNNSALILNNADWLGQFSFIDFLRDVGKHFRVGEMLGKESVRLRIQSEEGMSFTEFCYSLLQAYDFLHLHDHYQCRLQMGGSDQWGNIVAGIDLVRKLRGQSVHGLTTPLVVTATGQKFGKTEAGTIWLDPRRTSPYEFYQYWVRADDRDVIPWLKIFTFLPLEEIQELERSLQKEPEKRIPHHRLAQEVTELVHGKKISTATAAVSGAIFENRQGLPSLEEMKLVMPDISAKMIPRRRLEQGIGLT
jgi:tyrosyl-tRNA synthetase